jgi:hypothetical protein
VTKKNDDPPSLDFVIDEVTGLKLRDATREQVFAAAARFEAKAMAAKREAARLRAIAEEKSK